MSWLIVITFVDTDSMALRMPPWLEIILIKTGKSSHKSRLITLQLGNGCSISAIKGGQSLETSMGFTPLEGLVMGSRSGDPDPSIVNYLCQKEKVEPSEVDRWLNEQSGILGLSGRTNDMRELLQAADREQHEPSQLAIEVFCYRIKKYMGAYLAVLGGANAIVSGDAIGEAAPIIRQRICEGMVRVTVGPRPQQCSHRTTTGKCRPDQSG